MTNVLLINLNSEKKRLINSLDALYSIGISEHVTRIEACDENKARSISYRYISQRAESNIENIKSTCIMPNYAAVGCAISHYKCWKYILDNKLKGAFVVEDDIKIVNNHRFKNQLFNTKRIIMKNKEKNLFIVFNASNLDLRFSYYYPPPKITEINQFAINNIISTFRGTHFYYVNYSMAKELYENLINIDYQIDIEIGKFAESKLGNVNDLFLNITTDSLCIDMDFKSTIQFYILSLNEIIEIFKVSEDLARCIFNYIPKCLRKDI